MNGGLKRSFLVLLTIVAVAGSTSAVTRTWTGANGNDWFDILNWDPNTGTVSSSDNLSVLSGSPQTAGNVSADSGGSVTVDANTAAVSASCGNFTVGFNGVGTFEALNGASFTNSIGIIGYQAGSNGSATVDGGATWTSTNYLSIGHGSTGSLDITGEANVSATLAQIGRYAGSYGELLVDGAGSLLDVSGRMYVGYDDYGQMEITAGGKVENTDAYLAYSDTVDSEGLVTVTGLGSWWKNSGQLFVGRYGHGTLNILDQGKVTSTDGVIGDESNGIGMATVSGSGSNWINSGDLTVGYDRATGTLNIKEGGAVTNVTGYVGRYDSAGPGSNGTVLIEGTGSKWTNTDLYIGGDEVMERGDGYVKVFDNGALDVTAMLQIWGAGELEVLGLGNSIDANGLAVDTAGVLTAGIDTSGLSTIVVDGDVDFATGALLDVDVYSGAANGDYVFMSWTGNLDDQGLQFGDAPNYVTFRFESSQLIINVPEPATLILLGGLAPLLLRRRRRS